NPQQQNTIKKFYFPLGNPSRPHTHKHRPKKCESTGFLKQSLTPRSPLDLELDLITCLDLGVGNARDVDDMDSSDSDVECSAIGFGQSKLGAAVDKQRQQMQAQQRQRERRLQQKQEQDEFDAVAWFPDRKPISELMVRGNVYKVI
ncbi:UNVERIFIED_CONTAM: hypothetical protein HDU68_004996, partial [Siphonaria sp. JEL0065]